MAVERTLILIKPDAVERSLAGEILGADRAARLRGRRRQAPARLARARRGALRRAPREAVLRRARRVHHVRPDLGARRRGRGRDRDDAQDDRRDEPGGRRAGLDPRRPRDVDAEQPRPRLRLAGIGASARSRCGSRTMSSSSELPEYAVRNRASWTKSNEDYTHEQGVRAWKQDDVTWGVFSVPESQLNALRRRRRQGRDRARLRHRVLLRVARTARRAPGRRRRDARRSSRPRGRCSARRESSSRSSRRTPRRSRSRRVVRRRRLRVRRVDLVRPVQVDPRGGSPASTGRRARLPAQRDARRSLREPRGHVRDAPAPAARPAPARLGGRRHDGVPARPRRPFRLLRETGSTCST